MFGCGGIGLGAVQAAAIAGATTIIAVDVEDHRLAAAAALGATSTVNPDDADAVDAVRALSGGGVEIAIEAVGLPETATQAFAALTPGGRATILGMLPPGGEIVLPGRLIRQGRSITGTVMGNVRTRDDIPRYIELVTSGRLHADELVTARYPLDDINTALSDAQSRRGVRTMLHF